jgi:hypothetical protein
MEPTYDEVKRMSAPEFQGYMSQKIDSYHGEVVSMAAVQREHAKQIGSLCRFRSWLQGGIAAIGAFGLAAWAAGKVWAK